jgi:hypothetical protein
MVKKTLAVIALVIGAGAQMCDACTYVKAVECPDPTTIGGVACELVGETEGATARNVVWSCGSGWTSTKLADSDCLYLCPGHSDPVALKHTVGALFSISCSTACPPGGGSASTGSGSGSGSGS